MSIRANLLTLERQPGFPNEDLSPRNAELMAFYLGRNPEGRAFAEHLAASMVGVYSMARHALIARGIGMTENPQEYRAFRQGFAEFDTMALLVNPRVYSGTIAVRKAYELLVAPGDFADFELMERSKIWADKYPNVHDVMVTVGSERDETMTALHARITGAQVACELQTEEPMPGFLQ